MRAGHIDWAYALPLMVGVVPGARIGAHLTIGSSERAVRSWFGAMIVVLVLVAAVSLLTGAARPRAAAERVAEPA